MSRVNLIDILNQQKKEWAANPSVPKELPKDFVSYRNFVLCPKCQKVKVKPGFQCNHCADIEEGAF